MSEDTPRKGENRIYRLIDRGPIFLGLPILHAAAIGGITGVGYWIVRFVFGSLAGYMWVGIGFGVWTVAGALNGKDKTFMARLRMTLSGIVMREAITSYVPSDQTIEVK